MTVDHARAMLRTGRRIKVVVGTGAQDPTLVLWLYDGMVMSRSIAGWSEGTVEPVCALGSDFLRTYLLGREAVTIMDAHAAS